MKLTENTKVRIRVPKHLYEAIQAELDKKHMEEGNYGDHDKMEEDSIEEVTTGVEVDANKLGDLFNLPAEVAGAAIVGGIVMGTIAAPKIVSTIKTALAVAADKGEEYVNKLKGAFNKNKASVPQLSKVPELNQGEKMEEVSELEEVLDLQTLMEAVKHASEKKAEEKKEAEAKKKKEAEDKKKADEKKKKDAEAKKKAEAAKKK